MSERVERFMGPISSRLQPEADGEYVRYDDHLRLLREVEEQRDQFRRERDAYWKDDAVEAYARGEAEARAEAAEQHLEQVAQELERRAEKAREDGVVEWAFHGENIESRSFYGAYQAAAALLRANQQECVLPKGHDGEHQSDPLEPRCTCSYDVLLHGDEAKVQIARCPVHGPGNA